jgi:AraC-like DNA-binding protein
MRPHPIDLDFILTDSFLVKKIDSPYFINSYHFHKDYELVLVLKSTGKRIIGDHIENFKEGDLIFVGPTLPHAWFNDKEYYESKNLVAQSIVVYLKNAWLMNQVLGLPQTNKLKKLLEISKWGIKIKGKARKIITDILLKTDQSDGLKKSIDIFTILYELTEINDYELLASGNYVNTNDENEFYRINQVYEYVMKNFSMPIKLSEVSEIAHMSVSAFCKYFKMHTQKNLSMFVNEVRVSHACKLLQKKEYSISQVCFGSGFQSMTNFNKFFKKIMKKSPLEYRNEFLSNEFILNLDTEKNVVNVVTHL